MSKMKDNGNIEDIFRDAFQDFEGDVPDHHWDAIQTKLDTKPTFWLPRYKLAAAVVILALVSSVSYFTIDHYIDANSAKQVISLNNDTAANPLADRNVELPSNLMEGEVQGEQLPNKVSEHQSNLNSNAADPKSNTESDVPNTEKEDIKSKNKALIDQQEHNSTASDQLASVTADEVDLDHAFSNEDVGTTAKKMANDQPSEISISEKQVDEPILASKKDQGEKHLITGKKTTIEEEHSTSSLSKNSTSDNGLQEASSAYTKDEFSDLNIAQQPVAKVSKTNQTGTDNNNITLKNEKSLPVITEQTNSKAFSTENNTDEVASSIKNRDNQLNAGSDQLSQPLAKNTDQEEDGGKHYFKENYGESEKDTRNVIAPLLPFAYNFPDFSPPVLTINHEQLDEDATSEKIRQRYWKAFAMFTPSFTYHRLQPNTEDAIEVTSVNEGPAFAEHRLSYQYKMGVERSITQRIVLTGALTYTTSQFELNYQYKSQEDAGYTYAIDEQLRQIQYAPNESIEQGATESGMSNFVGIDVGLGYQFYLGEFKHYVMISLEGQIKTFSQTNIYAPYYTFLHLGYRLDIPFNERFSISMTPQFSMAAPIGTTELASLRTRPSGLGLGLGIRYAF